MAEATHSTRTRAGKAPDFFDLEGPIGDLVSLTRIADGVVENALKIERGEEYGDSFRRFTILNSELEDIAFMLGEVQYRTRLLSEQFYAAVEERA